MLNRIFHVKTVVFRGLKNLLAGFGSHVGTGMENENFDKKT
jgi:hypothetical protein